MNTQPMRPDPLLWPCGWRCTCQGANQKWPRNFQETRKARSLPVPSPNVRNEAQEQNTSHTPRPPDATCQDRHCMHNIAKYWQHCVKRRLKSKVRPPSKACKQQARRQARFLYIFHRCPAFEFADGRSCLSWSVCVCHQVCFSYQSVFVRQQGCPLDPLHLHICKPDCVFANSSLPTRPARKACTFEVSVIYMSYMSCFCDCRWTLCCVEVRIL